MFTEYYSVGKWQAYENAPEHEEQRLLAHITHQAVARAVQNVKFLTFLAEILEMLEYQSAMRDTEP